MGRLQTALALCAVVGVVGACSGQSSDPDSGDFARAIDIGNGRSVYLTCHGASDDGAPTVVLISGYHDSSDVWTQDDVLTLQPLARGPSVFNQLAEDHRVCAYDRPGTVRYIDGAPLTDRSTPVPQPRTTAAMADELHEVLDAAQITGPLAVVGHSLGGLIARTFAQRNPEQVRGVVFVDALSTSLRGVMGKSWPIYRDELLNPPVDQMPMASLRSPDSERVDIDASISDALAARFPDIPVAVLTKTEPFDGVKSLPGLPADDVNALFEQAQNSLAALSATTPQIIAHGSGHYIQLSQPTLVVTAIDLVEKRATR